MLSDGIRVARLMRDNGLKALQKRRYKKTTDSSHGGPIAANLLDRDFGCDGPDQKWGADISYIWTAEGWLYLAIVLDLYSPAHYRLGDQRSAEEGPGPQCAAARNCRATTVTWSDPTHRSRQPILFA